MQQETEWAAIGQIVAPFGIRGELKVRSLTDIPDRFTQLTTIYLRPDYALYTIQGIRPYKGEMLLLKLQGVDDATTAETLRNRDLCIPLEALAQLPPDSYYQHDILGLHVCTVKGHDVGTIADIIETGSNDVYVVKTAVGEQILIPAIKEVVKEVDLKRHIMYIDPIQGLLDDAASIRALQNAEAEELE